MTTPNIERLRTILTENLASLEWDGASGQRGIERPKFELHPRDYLAFAEAELSKNTTVSLINCVSHLKRAAECEIDTFLHIFGLYELFSVSIAQP